MNAFREDIHQNTIVHAWKDRNFEFSAHWHAQLEITVVLSGELYAIVNGTHYHLYEGDALLCGSNDIHSYLKSPCEILIIIMSTSFAESAGIQLLDNRLENHCVRNEDLDSNVKAAIQCVASRYADNRKHVDEINSLILQGCCVFLLGNILLKLKYAPKTSKNTSHMDNYMRKGLAYINQHYYEESISLRDVALSVGISECYFSRCFKTYFGYGVIDYINQKRIGRADKLLKETEMKITEIAMECGYGSLRNFNRVYKSIVGESPHEIREKTVR